MSIAASQLGFGPKLLVNGVYKTKSPSKLGYNTAKQMTSHIGEKFHVSYQITKWYSQNFRQAWNKTNPWDPSKDIIASEIRKTLVDKLITQSQKMGAFFFEYGMVCGDLKPANILVNDAESKVPELVFTDLGINYCDVEHVKRLASGDEHALMIMIVLLYNSTTDSYISESLKTNMKQNEKFQLILTKLSSEKKLKTFINILLSYTETYEQISHYNSGIITGTDIYNLIRELKGS
jgi:hypothetical protein